MADHSGSFRRRGLSRYLSARASHRCRESPNPTDAADSDVLTEKNGREEISIS